MVKEKRQNLIYVNSPRKRKGSELKGIKEYENAKKIVEILFQLCGIKINFLLRKQICE